MDIRTILAFIIAAVLGYHFVGPLLP